MRGSDLLFNGAKNTTKKSFGNNISSATNKKGKPVMVCLFVFVYVFAKKVILNVYWAPDAALPLLILFAKKDTIPGLTGFAAFYGY